MRSCVQAGWKRTWSTVTWLLLAASVPVAVFAVDTGAGAGKDVAVTAETAPSRWGPEYTTAGMALTVQPERVQNVAGRPIASYRVQATGIKAGGQYLLWAKWLSGKTLLLDRLTADSSGKLRSQRGVPLANESFNFSKMFRGEPVELTLIASDQRSQSFQRFIPFPLQAQGNRNCKLSVMMTSGDGTRFGLIGSGFGANENVVTELKSAASVQSRSIRTSNQGLFVTTVNQGVAGADKGGTASFAVAGKDCNATLTYPWGTAMRKL